MSATEIVDQAYVDSVARLNGYTPPKLRKWSSCRCSKNHKNVQTWVKCKLGYWHSNGKNYHRPTFTFRNSSNSRNSWIVLAKTYSGDYYSSHGNNLGYYTYDVWSFASHRESLNFYHFQKTNPCWVHSEGPERCSGRPCEFLDSYISQINQFRE